MKDQPEKNKNQQHADDEIDLIVLAKKLWTGRKTIIKTVLWCLLIGIFIAFISPNEYTASTTMVPQNADNTMRSGGLSSLASIAGLNLNMNQNVTELSPQVYPQIVQSVPFLLEIMNTSYTFPGIDHQEPLIQHFDEITRPGVFQALKKYTIGLPGLIINAFRKSPKIIPGASENEVIHLNREQEEIRKYLAKNLLLSLNEKEGYIQLTATFQDPSLAAQVAQKAKELLQQYIKNFKIEKASTQLQFIRERYVEKKKEFENTQVALADFRDRNKNVTSAIARTEEQQLQNEYQLAYEVYSQLAQQLEQAQIKVKEDSPVFSVIKPVTVPIEKSKPNRIVILIIWLFVGGIVGAFIILGKHFLIETKERWKEV